MRADCAVVEAVSGFAPAQPQVAFEAKRARPNSMQVGAVRIAKAHSITSPIYALALFSCFSVASARR